MFAVGFDANMFVIGNLGFGLAIMSFIIYGFQESFKFVITAVLFFDCKTIPLSNYICIISCSSLCCSLNSQVTY